MSQIQPIETSALIIYRVIFENILVEVYGVLVHVLIKFRSNSCGRSINLSDNLWVMILIQFEVISQPFTFYLQIDNMVNVVVHSLKLLAFFF